MVRIASLISIALLFIGGCYAHQNRAILTVSKTNIGKQITVTGWAVNRKIGAQLIGDGFDLWIDGLSSWPEGYYYRGDKGKKVKVTGILADDYGLPVFIPKKDEPIVQGYTAYGRN